MDSVPKPIFHNILLDLSYTDIMNVAWTCKKFGYIINDTNLWQQKILPELDHGYQLILATNKDFKCRKYITNMEDKRAEYLKICSYKTKQYIPGMLKVLKVDYCLARVVRENNMELTKTFAEKVRNDDYVDRSLSVYIATKLKHYEILTYLYTVFTIYLDTLLKGVARSGDLAELKRLIAQYETRQTARIQQFDDLEDDDDENNASNIYQDSIDMGSKLVTKSIKSGNLKLFKYTFQYCIKKIKQANAYVSSAPYRDVCDLAMTLDSVYTKNKMLEWAICSAAKCGHDHICSEILQITHNDNYNPSVLKLIYESGMHGASLGGNLNMFKKFKKLGANNYGFCLIYACAGGHYEIVEEIFKFPTLFTNLHWPAASIMHYVCQYGRLVPCQILIWELDQAGLLTTEIFVSAIKSCLRENYSSLLLYICKQANSYFDSDTVSEIHSKCMTDITKNNASQYYNKLLDETKK